MNMKSLVSNLKKIWSALVEFFSMEERREHDERRTTELKKLPAEVESDRRNGSDRRVLHLKDYYIYHYPY